MPGLAKLAFTCCQVDNTVNHGEITHYLNLFAAKATIQDPNDFRRGGNVAIVRKQKTLYRPAMQKLTGHGK
ncbi:Uncharacterised protein [Enterobacter cloacae]|nr:Uncharacterised protein [Enterobacter cloacae]VAU69373.1 Uncharacterised protein [Klebsiella pneumoniae]